MANTDVILKALKSKSESVLSTSQRGPSSRRAAKTKLTFEDKALIDFLDEKTDRL